MNIDLSLMNIDLSLGKYYRSPRETEIKKYSEERYPAWVREVKHFFQELSSNLENPTRTISFYILLENIGSIPAENFVIEFQALGGLYINLPKSDDDGENKDIISFPKPPIAPSGAWVSYQKASITAIERSLFPNNFDFASLTRNINNEKDKHAFYWKDRRPPMIKKDWICECAEFRHLVQPEQFEIGLVVPPSMKGENGALKCLITAKNLPEPVEYILPVIINYEKGETFEKAKQCLDQFLSSNE